MLRICFVIKPLSLANFSRPGQWKKGSIVVFAVCIPASYFIFFFDMISLFDGRHCEKTVKSLKGRRCPEE